jgi:ATP-dependent Clp protease ATP-binding subunit ClpX
LAAAREIAMRRFWSLRCSFCGETEHTVERLIAGPRVFICETCVDKCVDILGDKPEWRDRQIARLEAMRSGG